MAAPPSYTKIGEIDLSSLETLPTDLVVQNDNTLYVGGFNQRRVIKVENPRTPATAAISTYLTSVAGDGTPLHVQDWETGTGITSLDISPGGQFLLVTGSATNNPANATFTGYIVVVELATGTLFAALNPGLDGPTVLKATGGVFYGIDSSGGVFDGQVVTQFQGGTHLGVYPPSISSFGFVGAGAPGTFGRFGTDAEIYRPDTAQTLFVAANTRFFAPGDLGESTSVVAIRRYDPGASPTVFTSANAVAGPGTMGNGNPRAWVEIEGDGIAVNAYQGCGLLPVTDGINPIQTYVGVTSTVSDDIKFFNVDDSTDTFTMTTDIVEPVDFVHMEDAGGDNFLFVTQTNGRIAVFKEGAAILGDIDGDGVLTVADVTELGNLVADGTPPPAAQGDINGDTVVDAADVPALALLIVP